VRSEEAQDAAARAEVVVHLAALGDVDESFRIPLEYNRVNAEGTLNLLEGVRWGGGRMVFASTQRLYRLAPEPIREDGSLEPTNPYGYSKLAAETYCQEYARTLGTRVAVLRFFSVYGPGMEPKGSSGVVAIFLARARAGQPLIVHDRHMRRDFTHAGDVARGIGLAVESAWSPGATYNIATGLGTRLVDLALLARDLTGSDSPVVDDEGNSLVGLSVDPSVDRVWPHLVADCSRARRELGYEPRISLLEGLQACLSGRTHAG
jgi:UDP-glucose 4-epimerase